MVLSWDSSTVADGTYNLAAIARDAAGNLATAAAVNVTTDKHTTRNLQRSVQLDYSG